MRTVALALLVLSAPAAAEVEDPSRMIDRVFFAVYGGVGQVTAHHLLGPVGAEARGVLSGPAWAGGFSVGIWPVDFIGIDLSFEALDLGFGELDPSRCAGGTVCTGQKFGGFGLRLSPALRLALPLRYVAPYLGAGPALLVPFFSTGDLRGSPGPQFNFRFFAGSSIYLSPELRLFIEFHLLPFELSTPLLLPKAKTPTATQTIEGGLAGYLTVGLAFTPEDFKSSPSKGGWIALPIALAVAASALAVAFALPEAP